MSGQEDPEGKFGFSDRAPADAGGVGASGSSQANDLERPMTIDGDDLDIEDVTDTPFKDMDGIPGLADGAEQTSMLPEGAEVIAGEGALDEPSWVDTLEPVDGAEKPEEALEEPGVGGDTEDDMPARTMSLEFVSDEEPNEADGLPSDTSEEVQPAGLTEPEPEPEPEPEDFPLPEGRLDVVSGPDKGASFEVTDESVLVGRGLDCGVVVNDSSVSRKHFRLDREETGYVLVDLGSGNGSIVNGGKVQTLHLTDGARIEAGTTQLVWREITRGRPVTNDVEDEVENATLVGDLAAVEIDPDFQESRRPASPRQSPVSSKAHPPTEPVRPSPSSSRMSSEDLRTIAWAAVAVVFLVLAFVLVDRMGNLGILSGGTEEVTSSDSERAKEVLQSGLDAFREQRWYDAKAQFREAMKLDPSVPGGREAIDGVDAELDAWRALEDADKALDEDAFVEAITSLKKVQDISFFYPEAQELLKDVRTEAIGQAMENARKLADDGKVPEAIAALEKGLEIAPDDTDALALREGFRSSLGTDVKTPAGGKSTAAAGTSTSTSKRKRKSRPKKKNTGWSMDVKKPKDVPQNTTSSSTGRGSRGLALYTGGNFAGAIDYFDGVANGSASKRDRSKAQHLATAITKFDTFWRVGREAVVSGRVDDAIDALKKARKIDQSINGSWQKKIKRLLARQYAWKAERAYDQGDYAKAGKLARTAVNLDRTESAATRIYSEVQRKAESWLAKAKSMSASDPDRAQELLSKVLAVFPRDDSRYKSAYRLLNQLATDDDD